jgi:hypothetical protein
VASHDAREVRRAWLEHMDLGRNAGRAQRKPADIGAAIDDNIVGLDLDESGKAVLSPQPFRITADHMGEFDQR